MKYRYVNIIFCFYLFLFSNSIKYLIKDNLQVNIFVRNISRLCQPEINHELKYLGCLYLTLFFIYAFMTRDNEYSKIYDFPKTIFKVVKKKVRKKKKETNRGTRNFLRWKTFIKSIFVFSILRYPPFHISTSRISILT